MNMPISERETLKSNLDLIDRVERALDNLPYLRAAPAIRDLHELRNTLCEVLPGGYYMDCEVCGLPIGCDEDWVGTEKDAVVCGDCAKRHEQAPAAA